TQGDADLLVGTQMLAKGLDIPQVTLIGIVAADGLLNLADFRAGERAYQILTQVSGRAGRGAEPGQVILQTYAPEHPVIQAVQRQDYEAFVAAELGDRAALHYPPYGQLIVMRLSSPDESAVQQAAEQIAAAIRPSDSDAASPYTLLGPAPAASMRVARRYRWQILLKCSLGNAQRVIQVLDLIQWRSRISNAVSLTIDVDPLQLL
ncbi:MAG: helicase-related protein, partial [Elainellaceae cyanobacterium]